MKLSQNDLHRNIYIYIVDDHNNISVFLDKRNSYSKCSKVFGKFSKKLLETCIFMSIGWGTFCQISGLIIKVNTKVSEYLKIPKTVFDPSSRTDGMLIFYVTQTGITLFPMAKKFAENVINLSNYKKLSFTSFFLTGAFLSKYFENKSNPESYSRVVFEGLFIDFSVLSFAAGLSFIASKSDSGISWFEENHSISDWQFITNKYTPFRNLSKCSVLLLKSVVGFALVCRYIAPLYISFSIMADNMARAYKVDNPSLYHTAPITMMPGAIIRCIGISIKYNSVFVENFINESNKIIPHIIMWINIILGSYIFFDSIKLGQKSLDSMKDAFSSKQKDVNFLNSELIKAGLFSLGLICSFSELTKGIDLHRVISKFFKEVLIDLLENVASIFIMSFLSIKNLCSKNTETEYFSTICKIFLVSITKFGALSLAIAPGFTDFKAIVKSKLENEEKFKTIFTSIIATVYLCKVLCSLLSNKYLNFFQKDQLKAKKVFDDFIKSLFCSKNQDAYKRAEEVDIEKFFENFELNEEFSKNYLIYLSSIIVPSCESSVSSKETELVYNKVIDIVQVFGNYLESMPKEAIKTRKIGPNTYLELSREDFIKKFKIFFKNFTLKCLFNLDSNTSSEYIKKHIDREYIEKLIDNLDKVSVNTNEIYGKNIKKNQDLNKVLEYLLQRYSIESYTDEKRDTSHETEALSECITDYRGDIKDIKEYLGVSESLGVSENI